LLRQLPQGFTATATAQIAGRGRGSNVWVSPAGSLIFSTVVRHPIDKIQSAPVIFLQYLSAMAVVRGIKNYASGYDKIPVKLKWPNDICEFELPMPFHSNLCVSIFALLYNSASD
jgi:biotin--protein ligase